MSYKKATDILPEKLLKELQQYVDGEFIYIPKMEEKKKAWGENTASKDKIQERNNEIYQQYLTGISTRELADTYFLSQKTVQKIIAKTRKMQNFNNQKLQVT